MVYQQGIQRIADRRALDLGVKYHRDRRVEVQKGVDIHMADANSACDHRHGGVFFAELMQLCAPTGDQHVDVFV